MQLYGIVFAVIKLPENFLQRFALICPHLNPQEVFLPKDFLAFRINTLKFSMAQWSKWSTEHNIQVFSWPISTTAFYVSRDDANLIKSSTLVSGGELYPQGLQSMLPVLALNPAPGERVLDLCAAPGSKTSQIAALMANEGQLIANEPVKDRFYKLKSVLDITGAKAQMTMVDGRRFQAKEDLFDKILVDAPCSSEGRFCLDNPKSVGFWSVRKIHEVAHKQKGLLMNASRLLKPGGHLVYSTCTFAPEENEAVIDWILRKDPSLIIEPITWPDIPSYPIVTQWLEREFNPAVTGCLRVSPDAKLEGFFIAKLVKSHYK